MYQVVFITTKYFICSALVQRCSIDTIKVLYQYITFLVSGHREVFCGAAPPPEYIDFSSMLIIFLISGQWEIFCGVALPSKHLDFSYILIKFLASGHHIFWLDFYFRTRRNLLLCCIITWAHWLFIYIDHISRFRAPYISIRFLIQDTENFFVVLHYHPSILIFQIDYICLSFHVVL